MFKKSGIINSFLRFEVQQLKIGKIIKKKKKKKLRQTKTNLVHKQILHRSPWSHFLENIEIEYT